MKRKIKKGAIMAMMLSFALIALIAMTAPEAQARDTYPDAIGMGVVCGTCHVNPNGGGTRTADGNAFAAISGHSSDPLGAWIEATTVPAEICTGGFDEDQDGMVDCADQDCNFDPACEVIAEPEVCDDGNDNDLDGFVDCADPDCTGDPICVQLPDAETSCTDGVDNDGDGAIDCADTADCSANQSCIEPGPVCGNGMIESGEECDDNTASCVNCMIVIVEPPTGPPANHTDVERDDGITGRHAPGKDNPYTNGCTNCHGQDLRGIPGAGPSCYTCHGKEWDENAPDGGGNTGGGNPGHTNSEDGVLHMPGNDNPYSNGCTACHGQDLRGGSGPSCYTCHGMEWDENGPGGVSTGGGDNDSDDGDSRRRSRRSRRSNDSD